MECQDVRLLLAFAERPCEQTDAAEREAVLQHLHICPDCAALAQAERRADETLGQVLRDVPVPAELKQDVLKRLTAERGRGRWRWATAAAAAVLLLAVGLTWQFYWSRPVVSIDDVNAIAERNPGEEAAQQRLADLGFTVTFPDDFNYDYLRHVDIVEFKGRRVAKLTFERIDQQQAAASVLILPDKQFRLDLSGPLATNVKIIQKEGFTYLVFHRGDYSALLKNVQVASSVRDPDLVHSIFLSRRL